MVIEHVEEAGVQDGVVLSATRLRLESVENEELGVVEASLSGLVLGEPDGVR